MKGNIRHLILAALVPMGLAMAGQHTAEALHHATEAAKSVGDSKSVGEHASQALQHIDAAKAENPQAAKQLENSQSDLNSAVQNADRFNTESAAKDAADAKARLETLPPSP